MLDEYCRLNFGKDICLTEVFRTQAEHDALYKDVLSAPKTSPHCVWEGVDIRSTDFTDVETNKMLTFLNTFTYANGQRKVAIKHNIGNGVHFHVQFR